jgi:hypothetical protein
MLRNLCIGALLMWGIGAAASACSAPDAPKTTEEKFARATAVFVAHMVRTEEAGLMVMGNHKEPIIEGTFRVIEVLKGRPPEDGKVRSPPYGPGNCTIPLMAGMDYVFFLGPSDNKQNFVTWITGSFGTFNLGGTEPKRILDELRKLSAAQAK